MNDIVIAARGHSLVIFAGAGVSMTAPTSLPGWKPLNAAIFAALRKRLADGLGLDDALSDEETRLASDRDADRYPPDYQAQVLEEMCGERYFCGLQSLDVDVTNVGHRAIAVLAAAGAVRALITTNFDCLLERALDRAGVRCETAIDTAGYERLRDRVRCGDSGALPVVKIHGSVSDPRSMIDTLKQRRRGRSKALEECLQPFFDDYWVYLGFSADDLVSNPDYLGLVAGASRGRGATFVAFPGKPELGRGASSLMSAYGDRGRTVVADVGAFASDLCAALGQQPPVAVVPGPLTGRETFQKQLEQWTSGLSLSATGVCLAAVLESAHQSEPAARVLDRLARKEIPAERETPDFQLLQLQYGRLGAAFGRFINVPDLNGMTSNASVEAVQSLLRLRQTPLAARAMGWMPCLLLWINQGVAATQMAADIIESVARGDWRPVRPESDEAIVDAWLAAAQVCCVNLHPRTIEAVVGTFETVLNRSRQSGDVVRTGRVIALYALALAPTSQNLPDVLERYKRELNDALRYVGDGVTAGFTALALGWWHTGPGGMALARQSGALEPIAARALEYLDTAVSQFDDQGADPWILFARIHAAKALFDSGERAAARQLLSDLRPMLDRFPVFSSYAYEAAGQFHLAESHAEATDALRQAVASAESSGLVARKDVLLENYHDHLAGHRDR